MKKKILCLVLAIAMMLSLSAMVGAVDYDETTGLYTDETEITITKEYKLTNEGTTSPAETFTFTIEAYSVADSLEGVTYSNIPVPTITDAVYEEGEATTDGKETGTETIKITLPGLASEENPATIDEDTGVYNVYPGVGVYTYTITEDVGATAGVTYDKSTLYLVVTVIEQGGQLRVATVHAEGETTDKTDEFDDNTYSAGSLTVSKIVSGNLGDQTKSFDMTVTFTSELEVKSTISYGTSTIAPSAWTQNTDGTYSTNVPISLAHNEEVTFTNIPYGVSYVVEEDDYTSDGYNTTEGYSAYDPNREGIIETAEVSTTVTNTKTGTVDTGVILESMPYVMILAVVVVGGIALISKKKVSE